MIQNLASDDFDSAVSNGTTLVDFWATWCGPCRMQGAILDELSASRPDLKIAKVDVDSNMELAGKFGIMSIPALRIFKDGRLVASFDGVTQAKEIVSAMENA